MPPAGLLVAIRQGPGVTGTAHDAPLSTLRPLAVPAAPPMTGPGPGPGLACFLLEPTDEVTPRLRVVDPWPCEVSPGGHHAQAVLPDEPARWHPWPDAPRRRSLIPTSLLPADELPWPDTCDACGTPFGPGATRRQSARLVWKRAHTGTLLDVLDAPPGAMWDAWWEMPAAYTGDDGRSLTVVLPDSYRWLIDAPVESCDRLGRPHDCLVRLGEPPAITVHAPPEPSVRCTASVEPFTSPAGWRGWLRDGMLIGAGP